MLANIKLKRNYFLLVILVIFMGFMSWLLLSLDSDMLQIDKPTDFNTGWSIEENNDENIVIFRRAVTKEMLGKVICFYAYDAFVDADVDGIPVYHFGRAHSFLSSPGSLWHMIELPAGELDGILTIKLEYVYNSKFTSDIDIIIGSSGGIILTQLGQEAVDLFVNMMMLIFGVVLCFIFVLQLKNNMHNDSSLYLGLLSLCFVFWTNNNLFFTQLVFSYSAGQYFTYYFFLFMLPMLLMCYLETITRRLKFNYIYWSHIILVLALCVLQLAGIAEFTETLTIFLAYSGVEMLIVIFKLLKNKKTHRNRLLVIAFVLMVVCILVNAVMYFFSQTKGVSTTMAKLGISLYLLISIYVSLSSVITDLAEAKQSKILRKIAFTDSLTKVGNRYAFNNNINEIPLKSLSIFSLDINNLKYYNDTFGHACGDTLICEATKMLNSVFERLYRTGGDEFIAVQSNCTNEDLMHLKSRLSDAMKQYNDADPEVLVEIACGYSVYQEGDSSYEDILRRADAEMYKDKSELKRVSKVKAVR